MSWTHSPFFDDPLQNDSVERLVLEDGLGNGNTSPRLENSVKLPQRGALVAHVCQDCSSRDGIDTNVIYGAEVVSTCLNECALLQQATLGCDSLGVPKQRRRDVCEEHAQRWSDTLNSAKCHHTLASADVGQGLPRAQVRSIEHAVCVAAHRRSDSVLADWIATMPVVQQPLRPLIGSTVRLEDIHALCLPFVTVHEKDLPKLIWLIGHEVTPAVSSKSPKAGLLSASYSATRPPGDRSFAFVRVLG